MSRVFDLDRELSGRAVEAGGWAVSRDEAQQSGRRRTTRRAEGEPRRSEPRRSRGGPSRGAAEARAVSRAQNVYKSRDLRINYFLIRKVVRIN